MNLYEIEKSMWESHKKLNREANIMFITALSKRNTQKKKRKLIQSVSAKIMNYFNRKLTRFQPVPGKSNEKQGFSQECMNRQ